MLYKVKKSSHFEKWIRALKDLKGKITIARRIERMSQGNFGDAKSVGDSVSELRIRVGPGYRVYFTKFENRVVILLIGGDKSTQSKDITKAKALLEELKNDRE